MADKPGAPEMWQGRPEEQVRKVAQVANQLQKGYGNNNFKATLGTGTSTEVVRTNARSDQIAVLAPCNAAAAADFALGTTYAVVENEKVTIHHAAGAADREYGVALFG